MLAAANCTRAVVLMCCVAAAFAVLASCSKTSPLSASPNELPETTLKAEGVPLVVLAGAEYGTGSSRDWAAKGTHLLGVRAPGRQNPERQNSHQPRKPFSPLQTCFHLHLRHLSM